MKQAGKRVIVTVEQLFRQLAVWFFFSDLLFPKGRGVKLPTRGPLQGRILDLFLNLRVIF